jgi:uncharacterized protein (TIGR00369 family)
MWLHSREILPRGAILCAMSKLQDLLAKVRTQDAYVPIAKLIGFTMTSIEPGKAVVDFEAGEQHANPMGTLHGGVLCDIADAAMGMAYAANLGENETFTTLELKINFLKPVWKARLRATGHVVKQGRTVGLVECDIVDEGGSLVARATSTCLTLRGDGAQGR